MSWADYSYNTSVHSNIKLTSFEVVYGYPPPSLPTYVLGKTKVQAVDELLRDYVEILQILRCNLILAHDRIKSTTDRKRRDVSYNVENFVYLKLQPYHQTSLAIC